MINENKAFELEELFNNMSKWLEYKSKEIVIDFSRRSKFSFQDVQSVVSAWKIKEIPFLAESDKISHFLK